jgi:anti-sigma factor RsiW
MMNNCQNRSFLDEYLLGRLSDPDRDAFEEHFFNCKQCFRDVRDGQALLAAIRTHGQRIFADGKARRLPRAGWLRLLPYAFAGTAVLLAAWIGLRPRPQLPDLMPMTAPVSDAVRGAAVAPIAPLGSQSQAPSILEWQTAGTGTSYDVELHGPGLDWSARSAEARIELPADVRAKLLPGLEYRWQVRAFAPQGGFLGASEYAVFRLVK